MSIRKNVSKQETLTGRRVCLKLLAEMIYLTFISGPMTLDLEN